MKKRVHKNQIVITTLAVLIGETVLTSVTSGDSDYAAKSET